MRLSRTSMAVVAGVVFYVTRLIVHVVLTPVFGVIDWRISLGAGIAAGLATFWLAERFDLVAPALTPPVVDLYEKDEPDEREPRA